MGTLFKNFILELMYNVLSILLCSKVTQLYNIYILFLIFSSTMFYHNWFDVVLCATQQDLIAYSKCNSLHPPIPNLQNEDFSCFWTQKASGSPALHPPSISAGLTLSSLIIPGAVLEHSFYFSRNVSLQFVWAYSYSCQPIASFLTLLPLTKVKDVAWISCCCGCGVGLQLQLRFDPSLGTSTCCRCGCKKTKQKQKQKKQKQKQKTLELVYGTHRMQPGVGKPWLVMFFIIHTLPNLFSQQVCKAGVFIPFPEGKKWVI